MSARARAAFACVFGLLLTARTSAAFAEFKVPAMTGPVNDYAGVLSAESKERLDTFLRALWAHEGSQIAVLTVRDLGGSTVEEASIKTVDAWKLGTAKGDNGVLLLLSTEGHDLRIEVGQGLEGALPDAYAKRIVDNIIVPELRAGNFSRGVLMGVNGILAYTDPKAGQVEEPSGQAGAPPTAARGGRGFGGLPFPFKVIIVLAVILWIFSGGGGGGYRRRRGIFWVGGLGGGGGGGGGGWSGGGGGFSGGGASGKW